MDELEEIRQRKMAEHQSAKAQEDKERMMLQQLRKGAMLFLTDTARDRIDRASFANPAIAAQAEIAIVKMAQSGQISRENPLTEEKLVELLRQLQPRREPTMEWR